jgi:hypothetical protein
VLSKQAADRKSCNGGRGGQEGEGSLLGGNCGVTSGRESPAATSNSHYKEEILTSKKDLLDETVEEKKAHPADEQ